MHGISKEDEEVILRHFPYISSRVLSSVVTRQEGHSLISRLEAVGSNRTLSPETLGWETATKHIREMGPNWYSHIQENTLRFYCWYYYGIYVPDAPMECLWDIFTILSQEKPKNERFDANGKRI